jgi:hypothetical protein
LNIEDIDLGKKTTKMYTPPNFRSNFASSIADDDPRNFREALDSKNGKLYKNIMIE